MKLIRKLFSQPSLLVKVALVAVALPVSGFSNAVLINGSCVFGNCVQIGANAFEHTESGATNFAVTVNGDPFTLTGSYDAGYTADRGTFVDYFPVLTYTGAAGLANTDTITVDLLTSYFDPAFTPWDGVYEEFIPLTAANHSTVSGNLYVSIPNDPLTGVGLVSCVGPAACPGVSNSKSITGLTGTVLDFDYRFIFTFAPGTTPGSADSSPLLVATPEPASMIPAGLGLLGFSLLALRRRYKS